MRLKKNLRLWDNIKKDSRGPSQAYSRNPFPDFLASVTHDPERFTPDCPNSTFNPIRHVAMVLDPLFHPSSL